MAQTTTTANEMNTVTTVTRKPRRFFFNEDNSNNRRKVTIVYKHDRDNHTLTYGASVFHVTKNQADSHSMDSKTNTKPEKFDKDKHYETALERFNKHPVVIQNFQDEEKFTDFRRKVRKLLFTHRCRYHQSMTDSTKTTNVA
ncbi:hypothetical protein Klosneuvirus_4_44 [Klosneuvirus KNV1]|uniref:Uncharacterized protein n=1 Tax=Klosneuvirus KNV1 TaxID=1977640 RepID=A0A1V0SKF9_9VIRU|nr:hypothetical protein Klosneuvirus_4_44 [Klosneuvirus KNV1]